MVCQHLGCLILSLMLRSIPLSMVLVTVSNSLVKEGLARILDREDQPCLSEHFPKVEEHVEEHEEESIFNYLEQLLGGQLKIQNMMSHLVTSEKETKIVLEMNELNRKYQKLIEEMYDYKFELSSFMAYSFF